jgi:hypothetical protein
MILDNRERHLIPLLPADQITIQVLPIGDCWIGLEATNGLVIERKTIKDLEASVLDGRYREQKARLLAFCQEKAATPMYILEGAWSSTTGRIGITGLMKIVSRLQAVHGIAVLQTASLEETALLLKGLADYHKEDPTQFTRSTAPLRAVDTIHVVKKSNAADPKQFHMACLAQCPGVSTTVAESIVTAFPSWSAFMEASEVAIATIVQPNGRKVGPAVAKRLWGLFH